MLGKLAVWNTGQFRIKSLSIHHLQWSIQKQPTEKWKWEYLSVIVEGEEISKQRNNKRNEKCTDG